MTINYPKISIVTPVFNQVEYIEATIKSVLEQKYPNLEYIIIDGGSTDGTLEIIKSYESSIFKWMSEPDKGMYDAINKGFQLSSGELMGWINSDDVLLKNSLFNIAKLFQDLDEVRWVTGYQNFIDLKGNIIDTRKPRTFSFLRVLNKDFKWIQQESTIWKRSLWEEAGGYIDDTYKLAGDFELWFRFFQYTKLYNANLSIGAWRKREGQLSGAQADNYLNEVYQTINAYPKTKTQQKRLKKVKYYDRLLKVFKILKINNLASIISKREKCLNLENSTIVFSKKDKKYTQN